MTSRLVEDIQNQLERVDERIRSKELLLENSPDDVGLQLGLLQYEGLKEDLIRELAEVKGDFGIYTTYIKDRLKRTQEVLLKNRNLQRIEIEGIDLSDDIKFLELMEDGLINELEYCYLRQGIPIYEIRLTGKNIHDSKIPMAQLGEILLNIQEVPSSIAKFLYYQKKTRLTPLTPIESDQSSFTGGMIKDSVPEKKNKTTSKTKEMLSKDMVDNSQMYALGMIGGSVRILLAGSKPTLNNTLNDSFVFFKELVKCGDDKEALQGQIKKIGDVEPILKYKSFLNTLYKHKIDITFSGKTKELTDFDIIKLGREDAKTIYKALSEKDKPLEEEIIKIGMFRALDLESNTFKFHIDDEDKIISGSFKKELEPVLEDKTFNSPYRIKFLSSLPMGEFKKDKKIKYELLEFID